MPKDIAPEPADSAPSMDATTTSEVQPTRLPLNERMLKRLDRDYTYHSPTPEKQEQYIAIRSKAKELATLIAQCVPESRELHAALTSLETAVMQANAGIARNP